MEDRKNSVILLFEAFLHCGQWKSLVESVWGGDLHKIKPMEQKWTLEKVHSSEER